MLYLLYGLISAMLSFSPADAAAADEAGVGDGTAEQSAVGDMPLDARRFFELLVERYRNLTAYSDMSRVVQIIQHAGEGEPQRVETEICSEVADGALRTETALSQIRRTFGLHLPLTPSEPMSRTELRYQLWMLPHLTLKFSDEPLRDFRDGVIEGFTATDLAPVTVDDRPLVHLELRSGDGTSDESSATFDLYVDPDSMLIERIRGQQRLPDGGNYETTIEITTHKHESDPATDTPAYGKWPVHTRDAEGDREQEPTAEVPVPLGRELPEEPVEPSPYPYPEAGDPIDPDPIDPIADEPDLPEQPNPTPKPNPDPGSAPSSEPHDPQQEPNPVPVPDSPRDEGARV